MRGALLAGLLAVLALAGSAQAATIQVDTTDDELNDDSDCSLREAVTAAVDDSATSGCEKGQNTKRDTVKLQPGEQYMLDIAASTHENENANGDLDIFNTGPVTIKGNARGMSGPAIYAASTDRVIDIFGVDPGSVKIAKLNLEGGDISGQGPGNSQGGVIRDSGAVLKLDEVNLEHGKAGLGGAVAALSGNLTVTDSFLGQNDSTAFAGAIEALNMNRFKFLRSGVDSNEVVSNANPLGGGIVTFADRSEIADSTIEFNSVETTGAAGTARGGGIYSESDELTIRRSLVSGNSAEDAGGTSASFGGGVYQFQSKFDLVNSTMFSNDADGTGGAMYTGAGKVSNVTFSDNTGGEAGDDMAVNGAGPLKLRNSILPGSSDDLCAGSPGSFASKGYNVIQFDDPQCAFTNTDAEVSDVGFADGVPTNRGGPTFTIGIEKTSPARDLIPKRKCRAAHGEDQRGFKRPKGKKCDAGAFERGANP